MAVCPAGDDVIGPFLDDRKRFLTEVVNPLQEKQETLYVVPGSDAEAYATKRFPHKQTRRIANGLRPTTVQSFLLRLPHLFQRHRSEGLNCDLPLHIHWRGGDDGHRGHPGQIDPRRSGTRRPPRPAYPRRQPGLDQLRAKETSLLRAVLSRKIRWKGSPRLLLAFARCFPS